MNVVLELYVDFVTAPGFSEPHFLQDLAAPPAAALLKPEAAHDQKTQGIDDPDVLVQLRAATANVLTLLRSKGPAR